MCNSIRNILTVYLNIPLLIYEQVFRLQVSVDEVQGVKVLKGQYNLCCIKSCMMFTESQQERQSDTGVCVTHHTFHCHIYTFKCCLARCCTNILPVKSYPTYTLPESSNAPEM